MKNYWKHGRGWQHKVIIDGVKYIDGRRGDASRFLVGEGAMSADEVMDLYEKTRLREHAMQNRK